MVTYRTIELESKKIIEMMASSDNEIPGALSFLKHVKIHLSVYFLFIAISAFFIDMKSNYLLWLFFLAFGVFHWMVLSAFVSSLANLFEMVRIEEIKNFEIIKIMRRKLRSYGVVWLVFIAFFGVLGLITDLNIASVVIGNFIFTFFMFFAFNIDTSRYQISGLLGAIGAIRNKIS